MLKIGYYAVQEQMEHFRNEIINMYFEGIPQDLYDLTPLNNIEEINRDFDRILLRGANLNRSYNIPVQDLWKIPQRNSSIYLVYQGLMQDPNNLALLLNTEKNLSILYNTFTGNEVKLFGMACITGTVYKSSNCEPIVKKQTATDNYNKFVSSTGCALKMLYDYCNNSFNIKKAATNDKDQYSHYHDTIEDFKKKFGYEGKEKKEEFKNFSKDNYCFIHVLYGCKCTTDKNLIKKLAEEKKLEEEEKKREEEKKLKQEKEQDL